ncbi:zinc finger Y-chromosomal protein-like, partial [Cimex lectularius]|uniref:C2H2-type domain-containing protein n=1 Tax=Cimex lectularius TaxID=79782 RepID=A0A8I6SBS7_CIMLE
RNTECDLFSGFAIPYFPCPVCNKSYKYKDNLIRHQRFECGVEPQFKCQLCPYKAKQKGTLKLHMHNKHFQKFKHDLLEKFDPTQENRVRPASAVSMPQLPLYGEAQEEVEIPLHPQTHVIPAVRPSAGSMSKNLSFLTLRFVLGQETKAYVCTICERRYASSSTLRRHLRYECGKELCSQCPHCSYKTKYMIDLKKHIFNQHLVSDFKVPTTKPE